MNHWKNRTWFGLNNHTKAELKGMVVDMRSRGHSNQRIDSLLQDWLSGVRPWRMSDKQLTRRLLRSQIERGKRM